MRAMKPIPEETENGVPVSFSASRPPTGDDNATAMTVISGNLKLEYSMNSSMKISRMVMGTMT